MSAFQQYATRVKLTAGFPLRVGRFLAEEMRYPFMVRRWHRGADARAQQVLRDLARQGYHCVEGFWDDAAIRSWQQRIDAYCVHDLPEKLVKRRAGGTRWLRLERGLPELAEAYVHHPLVREVAAAYHRRPDIHQSVAYQHSFFDPSLVEVKARNAQVGRGRESFVIGLGREGFHVDDTRYGLKTALFLTDVEAENGPLTYCPGTHRAGLDRFTLAKHAKFLRYLYELNTMELYCNEHEAERFGLQRRAVSFTVKRGTVVFFETQGFHRASLILRGERKVLWGTFGTQDRDY